MKGDAIFDDLSRAVASGLPRRRVLKLILLGLASPFVPFPRLAWGKDICKKNIPCPTEKGKACADFDQAFCVGARSFALCRYVGTRCNSDDPTCLLVQQVIPCDICEKCVANATTKKPECVSRCKDPKKPSCCVKKEKDGSTSFGDCCKSPDCCRDGKCVDPQGKLTRYDETGIEMTIQEDTVGLGRISVAEVINATVDIPPFVDGTTAPVVVTAAKIDLSRSSFLLLDVQPATACGCNCGGTMDPTVAQLSVPDEGRRAEERFERVPRQERFLTLQNGDPGLRRIQVWVNGELAASRRPDLGQTLFLDVADLMSEEENVVTVVGNGRPGASALVVVSDVPSAEGFSGASVYVPPIAWQPTVWQPGHSLRWGR